MADTPAAVVPGPPENTDPLLPLRPRDEQHRHRGLVDFLLVRRLRSQWARAATVILTAAWAIAMGLSRVVLGHHWLTDVSFAWLLGAAWLALLITSHRLYLTIRRAGPAGAAREAG